MVYEIYTDGACSVNKRLGGYAAIAQFDGQQVVLHGNKKHATNNEMELLAVLAILHALFYKFKPHDQVIVYSDSAYVVNAINQKWVQRWIDNGWKTKENKRVKNGKMWVDLQLFLEQMEVCNIQYSFVKVKGHDNVKLNNYVDRLAVHETQILKDKQLED